MNRIHVVTVALLLGTAAVFGVVAATRTAHVGASGQVRTSGVTIAGRSRRLARIERQLRRALHDRPPALPAVPAIPRPAQPPAAQVLSAQAQPAAQAPPARVVYRRPAPLVVVTHSGGHGEQEHESEGGND